ncbi:helix-turn-helix domain-containing protein [Agrobacterium rubi]|uniref:helix-turn-helix domain-containing protein n=1 Tax=Agrobacterium rubi TaxID=28099 RepID=UPI00157419B1|nr:helix-turn-helix transcriptional regulator [Agrobacterium rubi]NTE87236.1 helix-turn-helix transcriptional regulator [Agrobacterium rubi]NTF03170.1 helix-turn-helix transcriptional regulator [Agrobacterium rubi]
MKLAQYLTDKNVSLEQFASEVGSSVSGIRKWMYGERVPRPDQMRKIADLTGGLVEPNDFILPQGAQPESAV